MGSSVASTTGSGSGYFSDGNRVSQCRCASAAMFARIVELTLAPMRIQVKGTAVAIV